MLYRNSSLPYRFTSLCSGLNARAPRPWRWLLIVALASVAILPTGLGGWLRHDVAAAFQTEPPSVGPGIPNVGSAAPRTAASSSKAGSLLFFHKYTSDLRAASQANTLITLTNTNPRDGVALRLAWVHGCAVTTTFLTLGANQTKTLVASQESPNQTGYLMVMAVSAAGVPLQHNWLMGTANYRDARGFNAQYHAFAVAKRSAGTARTDIEGRVAELNFNNTDYDRLPRTVALDNLQNQSADSSGDAQTKTDVVVYSPLTNLATTASQGLKLNAIAYDQSGRPYPQQFDNACGLSGPVTTIWSDFNNIVTPTRQGWASFGATVNNLPVPVLGASLIQGISIAPQQGIRSMQVLSWVDSFKMTVNVVAPTSGAPADPITQAQPEATGNALGASDSRAGTALIFPRFVSGVYGSTRLHLTNTHPTQRARLRVFFTGLVEPALMNETLLYLQPNQTITLNANDFAANQKGWVMALVIDGRAQPTQHNFLIGSATVNEQPIGVGLRYNALAFGKNTVGATPRNSDATSADLLFDDTNFDRLPATMALNAVQNQQDVTTYFGFARAPLSLLDAPVARGSLNTVLYDDLLGVASATIGQIETRLGLVRPNAQTPPITATIQKGHRGWLKFNSSGAFFPWVNTLVNTAFAAQTDGSWAGGWPGGGNLHILTLSSNYSIRTAANNPNNQAPLAEFEPIGAVLQARTSTGVNVRLDGRVSRDPDGEDDPLSYKWYDNEKLISEAKVTDYRFGVGEHVLKLVVLDGNNTPSEPTTHYFRVEDTMPPLMSGIPSSITKTTASRAGIALDYKLPVAYDMVDGYVYVAASKLPGSVFPIGKTTVTFTARDNAGNETRGQLLVEVKSGGGTLPTIGGIPSNKIPTFRNLNDQYVIIGKPKTINLVAEDADGEAVTFRLLNAPAYARLDAPDPITRSVKLIIAPKAGDQVAASNVRLEAIDARGATFQSLPFLIQISDTETLEDGTGTGPTGPIDPGPNGGGPIDTGGPTNKPPTAVMAALPAQAKATTKQGAIVKFDGSGSTDPDLDNLSYEWRDRGVKIAEGALPEVTLGVGIHVITLTVSDGKGGTNTSAPQTIEVLPRDLTITAVSAAKIPVFNQITLTVTGTGFFNDPDPAKQTKLRFDCSSFCSGGSQIAVTIVSIEEDTIVATVRTTQNTPLGNRDAVVTNPNGALARLSRSNYVSR